MARVFHGFTLLEVLVAVVLVAIALIAGQRSVSQSLNVFSFVKQHQIAVWVAQNQASVLYAGHVWPDLGQMSFDCSDMGVRFTCRRRVSSTEDSLFREAEFCVFSADNHSRLICLSVVINHAKGML
ncbi:MULTISPECIES: type II secretion system minor pseudopilin GspI [Candidatus Ichthyocystis]|uniref:Type II secretion system protein I n=1 Tax=Candidatus Ichthyocystis hellenicum TaxID=1561003 RepID=A0A0S4M746_9BURK|nr:MULTISPECIES: type II secretion system minor pseudopilin GspI [Ichthyocystis]CUT17220.1 putative type II secretion system protein I [Candidatus Ichthyocystis hellenicum]